MRKNDYQWTGPVGIVGPCGTRGPGATEPPPGYHLQLHDVVARRVYPPNIEDVMMSRLAFLWFVLWRVAVLAVPLLILVAAVMFRLPGSAADVQFGVFGSAMLGAIIGLTGLGLAIVPNVLFWVVNGRGLIGDLQEAMRARQVELSDARMRAISSSIEGWIK